jgi:formylglycine-generating enzyme required for sulfatase activity
MRLPTEVEWEKAAGWEIRDEIGGLGAGKALLEKKRIYPWGNKFDKNKCNTEEAGVGETTPVGQYSPEGDSPCGAADMAGNVWEWVHPFRVDYWQKVKSSSKSHVLRGGSFDSNSHEACVTCHFKGHFPSYRHRNRGFRVACPITT